MDRTERMLLHAILEEPQEKLPRLVYADWLEENGREPRAEFIRAQIALDGLEEGEAKERLLQREADLRSAHEAEWRAELPEIPGLEWGAFAWGMVETAHVRSWKAFKDGIEAAWQATPIQSVRFSRLSARGAQALARHPGLARLFDRLDLRSCAIGDAGLAALAESPHFRPFHLVLDSCGIGDDGIAALARSERAARLNSLALRSNHLNEAGAAALGASPHLGALQGLFLDYNSIGSAGLAALLRGLPGLTWLQLDSTDIDSTAPLAGWPGLRNLGTLEMEGNGLTPAALAPLLRSGRLDRLRHLDLSHNPLGQEGAEMLSAAAFGRPLDRLSLGACGLGDEGVAALAGNASLRAARHLRLYSTDALGPATARTIAESFARLEELWLFYTTSGDEGAEALASSSSLASLRHLDLYHTHMGERGAMALARTGKLPALRELDVRVNDIPMAARKALRRRYGEGLKA
ncbi:MAG: TIGR02996 domain-containing protein [Gemmataceae bacterium]|nr:TIGR02996 domain-containing protein [Gemmataceae bacterium]